MAAALDTSLFYALHQAFGVPPLLAACAGFSAGLALNYVLSAVWVFESRIRVRDELPLFAAIGIGGLAWTELILWLAISLARWPPLAAKLSAVILVLFWNFGMRKRFVFARPAEGC